MFTKGFDNDKYVHLQSQKIRDRISQFGGKLYLEFGGKLFDDYHASRVLPGFEPDSKVKMLLELKADAEIIIVINADAIEKNKRRGDLGITYDQDVLRLMDAFTEIGLFVGSDFFANLEGIDWFINNVLKSVDMNLLIVGKGTENWRSTYRNISNLDIIGTVDDIKDYYDMVSKNPRKKDGYKLIRSSYVHFEHKDVPIDPYIFGLWLGDGDSAKARFTSEDQEVIDYLTQFGK